MSNKMPNGNIIVGASGEYNRFDGGAHKNIFEKIKQHYAVGNDAESRMLTSGEIGRLAPKFIETLSSILNAQGDRAIDLISRKGRVLTSRQVELLLAWLNNS
jgi:hypothetical protein